MLIQVNEGIVKFFMLMIQGHLKLWNLSVIPTSSWDIAFTMKHMNIF